MFSFFIRFLIIILGLLVCLGFSSAVLSFPIIVAIVFVCSWLFLKSFQEILLEIIVFALIYDFLVSYHVGSYFFLIVFFAFVFDFIKRFVFKVSSSRIFLAYLEIVLLSISIVIFFSIQQKEAFNFFSFIKLLFVYSAVSVFFFFFFSKIIAFLEKIIFSYTHKINVKRHI